MMVLIFADNSDTRLGSLKNGLSKIENFNDSVIFVHEAARPLLGEADIEQHMKTIEIHNSAVSVKESIDTMFTINENGEVESSYAKSSIVKGYTPQSYRGEFLNMHLNEINEFHNDEDLLMILNKHSKAKTIICANDLRKITTPDDVEWLKGVL